jgi:hypothetical protein
MVWHLLLRKIYIDINKYIKKIIILYIMAMRIIIY